MLIFQKSFLISGIMCFGGCGSKIQELLDAFIEDCKKDPKKPLPADARLIVDTEPFGLGDHFLVLSIESDDDAFVSTNDFKDLLESRIKNKINNDKDKRFKIREKAEKESIQSNKKTNWINIGINLLAITAVIVFSILFPPSIPLTVCLTLLSFLATAFTARKYLIDFFRNLRKKKFANMSTTISLGWFLSLAHTLFHIVIMPLASSFSMIFMGFVMPILLITCINCMDELKRLITEKTQKMQLKGMDKLFPEMAQSYTCYSLSKKKQQMLSDKIRALIKQREKKDQKDDNSESKQNSDLAGQTLHLTKELLSKAKTYEKQKKLLKEGMLIQVKSGKCFPIDCVLMDDHASIDASLLTGEPQQRKRRWQEIPAGAINLGQTVTVFATQSLYQSSINALLFGANRKKDREPEPTPVPKFAYFYTALVIIAMLAAILVPLGFGVITAPLVLQNVIGILFSICPCTIAIALQLSKLISRHHRSKKGIHLQDESLLNAQLDKVHTIILDKTGTLTTSHSEVESSSIPMDHPLWARIYLLERDRGQGHPLASAIQKHYKTKKKPNREPSFNEVGEAEPNEGNGLSAYVQGKHLQIGSYDYIKNQERNKNLTIPPEALLPKLDLGLSVSYVVEDGQYMGLIYFQHELREGVQEALEQFQKNGKNIIMLTGDNEKSAQGLNKKMGSLFTKIYAGHNPNQKEALLEEIMAQEMKKESPCPEGVWFIGDGLNDAPALRKTSQLGGTSCAMQASDKAAFFADIILGGFLGYVGEHYRLNRSLITNTRQNQAILAYSTLAFLAFIISFSVIGLGVSPLIPMGLMVSTTLFVLFNSYRSQLVVDVALDKISAMPKKLLASHFSLGLLLTASTLIIASTIAATIATGGLALPFVAFTAGTALAFSSACTLSSIGLLAAFGLLFSTALWMKPGKGEKQDPHLDGVLQPRRDTVAVTAEENRPEQVYKPLFQEVLVDLPLSHGISPTP